MITQQELLSRPEAQLAFPGSVLLYQQGADEGEGCGFDNLDPSAMVDLWRRTPAAEAEILVWFATRLDALGWIEPHPPDGGPTRTFSQGSGSLTLSIVPVARLGGLATIIGQEMLDHTAGTVYRLTYRATTK